MADRPELLDLARRIAGWARDGEQLEAFVVRSRGTEVRAFEGAVESLTTAEEGGVGVRVVVGGREGAAWGGSLDDDVVEEAVREARDNAAFGAADPCFGVTTPEEAAGPCAELDVWDASLLAVSTDDKVELALEAERSTRARDPRVRGVEAADYGDTLAEAALANSLGVEASTRRTVCSLSVVALAGEGAETQTGYGFSVGRAFGDLDVEATARDAVERSVRLLGAVQPRSRRLPVVLDPLVTRSLLSVVGHACNGEAIVKGRSMFVGREGETVAAPGVTLVDDPTIAEALGAATHDSEGVPTRRVELVVDGELRGFLHNCNTARRSGGTTTGSAVRGLAGPPGVGARALHLRPGTRPPEALLGSVPEALYVQSVSGLHSGTNPVSGDFSVGAEGLMVRGGAFAEPVREITIASTLPRILQAVREVGNDLTWLPGGSAGVTLLIGEMSMSGG